MRYRRIGLFAVFAALLMALLSGCGGKTSGDTNTTATSSNWDQMKWDQGKWK